AHAIARALVTGLDAPLTAPSANPPDAEPPRTLGDARDYFGDAVAAYVDGGPLPGGASTVAALDGDRVPIIRAGPVTDHQRPAARGPGAWRSCSRAARCATPRPGWAASLGSWRRRTT